MNGNRSYIYTYMRNKIGTVDNFTPVLLKRGRASSVSRVDGQFQIFWTEMLRKQLLSSNLLTGITGSSRKNLFTMFELGNPCNIELCYSENVVFSLAIVV
jgi:hypothetical protein